MSEDNEDITITDSELILLANNPAILADIFDDSARLVALRHWPFIVSAITAKALNGDLASAKFLHELITPLVTQSSAGDLPGSNAWEDAAIALRDALGLEASAEQLVTQLLVALNAPENQALVRSLLFEESTPE